MIPMYAPYGKRKVGGRMLPLIDNSCTNNRLPEAETVVNTLFPDAEAVHIPGMA